MKIYQELRNILTYREGPITYLDRYYRDRREFVEPWKFPMYLYHKIAKELWRKDYIHDFYVDNGESNKKALLITHITPFYRDPEKYDPRPGRWSKVENARILNKFGFSVDIYNIIDSGELPENIEKYDLIMGKGPKFERCARRANDDTLIILYATGMPQQQVVDSYKKRIAEIENRKKIEFSPERPNFFNEASGEKLADVIIVMGDGYTARMFEKYVPEKPVYNVSTTHPPGYESDIENKDYNQARTNFLWFGGTGAVLKGLDRVLDVFDQRTDVCLYVCGPIRNNSSFFELYEEIIYENDNIYPMGWTDIRSPRFKKLVTKCGYLIYPSATEGSSGAVAACRWRGVVPIVTKEVIAETDGWGVTISDAKISTINKKVTKLARINPDELASMTHRNYEAAREQYSQEHYTERMNEILDEVVEKFDMYRSSNTTTLENNRD